LVVAAISLVRVTRLMWDDFILVAIVLVAHTPIEQTTVEIGKWLADSLRAWRHAAPPASSRSHSEGE